MKKLVVLMMVLGTASMALAAPAFQIVNPQDNYSPSQNITINLVDSGAVIGMEFDAITDHAGGAALGTAVSDAYNGSWDATTGTSFNIDGLLVEGMGASMTNLGKSVSGILYSFVYHVPDVQNSTIITIQSLSGTTNQFLTEVTYADGQYMAPPETSLALHVVNGVPEPATMALLGLGGLFLRHRSKKQQTA